MNFDLLVFTICQWGLFIGLVLFLLSWAEKKRKMGQVGVVLLFLLGLFAAVINLFGLVHGPISQNPLFHIDLWGIVLVGVFAAIGWILELKKKKGAFLIQLLAVVLAVLIFFQFKNVINNNHSQNSVISPKEQIDHH